MVAWESSRVYVCHYTARPNHYRSGSRRWWSFENRRTRSRAQVSFEQFCYVCLSNRFCTMIRRRCTIELARKKGPIQTHVSSPSRGPPPVSQFHYAHTNVCHKKVSVIQESVALRTVRFFFRRRSERSRRDAEDWRILGVDASLRREEIGQHRWHRDCQARLA